MPVETRATRQRNAAKLTNMPAEVLEQIFEMAYAEQPPHGPICKKLLPFHRRRLSHLSLPADLEESHLASFFPSLTRLKSLEVVACKDVVRLLRRLPRPEGLRRLDLLRCDLKPAHMNCKDAQQALSGALSSLTSLETFRLSCAYDARTDETAQEGERDTFDGLPSSLFSLPLKHLILGRKVLLDAEDLVERISSGFPDSLKHLTLRFFEGEYGRDGRKCWTWHELLDSWDLPKWRAGFDREDLEDVFEAAKKRGMEVDGSVIQAAGVEDAFRNEKEEFWALKEDRDRWGGRDWDDGWRF